MASSRCLPPILPCVTLLPSRPPGRRHDQSRASAYSIPNFSYGTLMVDSLAELFRSPALPLRAQMARAEARGGGGGGGGEVVVLGSNTGNEALALALLYPKARVTGVEIICDLVDHARRLRDAALQRCRRAPHCADPRPADAPEPADAAAAADAADTVGLGRAGGAEGHSRASGAGAGGQGAGGREGGAEEPRISCAGCAGLRALRLLCGDAMGAELGGASVVFLDDDSWDASLSRAVAAKLTAEVPPGALVVTFNDLQMGTAAAAALSAASGDSSRSAAAATAAATAAAELGMSAWVHEGCYKVRATWSIPLALLPRWSATLSRGVAEAAREAWRRFDADQSGSVDADEFRAAALEGLRAGGQVGAAEGGQGEGGGGTGADSGPAAPPPSLRSVEAAEAAIDAQLRGVDADGDGAVSRVRPTPPRGVVFVARLLCPPLSPAPLARPSRPPLRVSASPRTHVGLWPPCRTPLPPALHPALAPPCTAPAVGLTARSNLSASPLGLTSQPHLSACPLSLTSRPHRSV